MPGRLGGMLVAIGATVCVLIALFFLIRYFFPSVYVTFRNAVYAATGMPIVAGYPRVEVECSSSAPARTMVALTIGQSNAANYGKGRQRAQGDVRSLFDGRCFKAMDPLPGASGDGASVWIRLADLLIEAGSYDTVVLVAIAEGSSEIARWAPRGDLHPRIHRAIEMLRARGLEPTHIFWHQGESDRQRGTHPNEYRERFRAWVASVRSGGVKAPVYVAVATYCHGQRSEALRQAQRLLPDEELDIHLGPDTDLIAERGDRFDDCHFSSAGLNRHARAWFLSLSASDR